MSNEIIAKNGLKVALGEKRKEFAQKADAAVKKLYEEGIDQVRQSQIESQAKQVGDQAPGFALKNAVGETITLANYLQKGPVVLTWYRGGWCPYCNIALQFLQRQLPDFQAKGASLIALTPELPDHSLSTKEKHQLGFEVLSDVGNAVARHYGLVFALMPEVATNYKQHFDLQAYNGDSSDELPLAATYVVGQDGSIVYAFLDADYRNRAEPGEILAALGTLG